MARVAKKAKPHLDLWAANESLKRHNRQLRQVVSDLKWECRALRVQLYAEKKYAEKFATYFRVADGCRNSSDSSPVDADPDRGEVRP
jgi:hypothetical protein